MRVVITGNDADGRSTVVSDQQVPDRGVVQVYRTGDDPDETGPPSEKPHLDVVPPLGGASWLFVDVSPDSDHQAAAEMQTVRGMDEDGWHTTPTVDYLVILSGSVVLLLDTAEVPLHAGDCVVQRGTRHAWRNRTDTPARMACVMVRP